jgi:hypothetical protein
MSFLVLGACAQVPLEPKPSPENETYKAGIGIVNHTDRYIYGAAVNGAYGGHSHKLSAGIANFCCVNLPEKWHPGLAVKVDWDMPEGTTHIHKSKMVDVEKYDEPSDVYLHFFPDDMIRVVVTKWVGASPNHPIAPPPGTKMFGSQ